MVDGGVLLKMWLVKGCNLEMEMVIFFFCGWFNLVRILKIEVDVNYLYILEWVLLLENVKVLYVGVVFYNLFIIVYVYLLSWKLGSVEYMIFEMLEGMVDYVWCV